MAIQSSTQKRQSKIDANHTWYRMFFFLHLRLFLYRSFSPLWFHATSEALLWNFRINDKINFNIYLLYIFTLSGSQISFSERLSRELKNRFFFLHHFHVLFPRPSTKYGFLFGFDCDDSFLKKIANKRLTLCARAYQWLRLGDSDVCTNYTYWSDFLLFIYFCCFVFIPSGSICFFSTHTEYETVSNCAFHRGFALSQWKKKFDQNLHT